MNSRAGADTVSGVRSRRLRLRHWQAAAAAVALALVSGWFWTRGQGAVSAGEGAVGSHADAREAAAVIPRVEVIRPGKEGVERATVQPGSVHAFEMVDLHTMVSGYLKVQHVDIGSRVKKGQVLAELDVPRERNAALEAAAMLEQARSHKRQAESKVKAMEADRDTAAATLAQTHSEIDRLVANRKLAEGQYARIKDLVERRAVQQKLLDEQQRDLESAAAAERTGRLAAETANAQLAGAVAKIDQSQADVAAAAAAVGVAEARLETARVDLEYSKIIAPFDGVVTQRNFHPGAFIRSASDGSQLPLLNVARCDLMRVVIRVPDRDVVLTNAGDPATLTVDALGEHVFRGVVSRVAESEDHVSRTMRVEVDVPNPDGLLREGMYGRARIRLEHPSRRLTVPPACIIDRPGRGHGVLQVVREGKVHRLKVQLGTDNGKLVEVTSGLGAEDEVVLRSSTPLEDGMQVSTQASG